MIISPWEIYLVMQLDSFSATAFVLSVVLGIALAVLSIVTIYASVDQEDFAPTLRKIVKWNAVAFTFFLLAATVIPSSKTAAAMIVIPAVLNNQSVQVEAKELYALAKQGFTEMVKTEVAPAKTIEEATEE